MKKLFPKKKCIFRVSNLYGNELKKGTVLSDGLKNLLSEYPQILKNPTESLDFIHIQNLLEVIEKSISKKITGLYNCASSENISLIDIINLMSSCLNIDINLVKNNNLHFTQYDNFKVKNEFQISKFKKILEELPALVYKWKEQL